MALVFNSMHWNRYPFTNWIQLTAEENEHEWFVCNTLTCQIQLWSLCVTWRHERETDRIFGVCYGKLFCFHAKLCGFQNVFVMFCTHPHMPNPLSFYHVTQKVLFSRMPWQLFHIQWKWMWMDSTKLQMKKRSCFRKVVLLTRANLCLSHVVAFVRNRHHFL